MRGVPASEPAVSSYRRTLHNCAVANASSVSTGSSSPSMPIPRHGRRRHSLCVTDVAHAALLSPRAPACRLRTRRNSIDPARLRVANIILDVPSISVVGVDCPSSARSKMSQSSASLPSPTHSDNGAVSDCSGVSSCNPATPVAAAVQAAATEMIQQLRPLSESPMVSSVVPGTPPKSSEAIRLANQCARHDLHEHHSELMHLLRYARSSRRVRHHARLQDELKSTSPAQVHVRGVSLATCVMDDATLQHSDFSHADLENASLRRSNISKTSFFAANLRNAVFDGATLSEIDFTAADLTGASFRDCDAHALTHNVAVYGACLHNVTWPNAEVDFEMQRRASCQCMTVPVP